MNLAQFANIMAQGHSVVSRAKPLHLCCYYILCNREIANGHREATLDLVTDNPCVLHVDLSQATLTHTVHRQ